MKNIKLTNQISLINKKFKKKEFYHYLKTSNLSLVIPKIKDKYIVVSQKRVPINNSVNVLAIATAGFAKEVEEVNQRFDEEANIQLSRSLEKVAL